jgi:hypothetical protein
LRYVEPSGHGCVRVRCIGMVRSPKAEQTFLRCGISLLGEKVSRFVFPVLETDDHVSSHIGAEPLDVRTRGRAARAHLIPHSALVHAQHFRIRIKKRGAHAHNYP